MASNESIIKINKFTGLNTNDSITIDDTELTECLNFDLSPSGELKKRPGLVRPNNTGITAAENVLALGVLYIATGGAHILARTGQNIWYTADGGVSWTGIFAANASFGTVLEGTQYNDTFYMVNGSATTIWTWNGSVGATITPTPVGSSITAYKDRLWVANRNSTVTPSRLYFSKIADFTSATGWPSTNFLDVSPNDGDYISAIVPYQDLLYIFKSRSIWVLYVSGDPTTWTLKNTFLGAGCTHSSAIKIHDDYIYFMGAYGFYKTDGTQLVNISSAVKTFFDPDGLGDSVAIPWSIIYGNRLIFVGYGAAGTPICLVYYFETGGWSQWTFASGIIPFGMVNYKVRNRPESGVYIGTSNGNSRIYRLEEDYLTVDDGVNFECRFKTKIFDLGEPTKFKRGKLLVADYKLGVANSSFIHYVDGVARPTLVITGTAGTLSQAMKIKAPGFFRRWQMQYTSTVANAITFYGYSLYMHYKKTTTKAST